MNRAVVVMLGGVGVVGLAALWHGPLGAGQQLSTNIEANARATLDRLEMTQVQAHMDRQPLRRTLTLSGPADDFQRRELVRIMSEQAGVGEVRWDPASLPAEAAR